jgi:hypothetical protein
MVQVEKVFDQQKRALALSLYIEGKLNNASYDSMCAALVKQGFDHIIVQWIRATLEGHLAVATLNEFSMRVAVSRNCPQGSVLSLILLSLFVDDLITSLIGVEFKATWMTFAFQQWENSQTPCWGSCSGPYIL